MTIWLFSACVLIVDVRDVPPPLNVTKFVDAFAVAVTRLKVQSWWKKAKKHK